MPLTLPYDALVAWRTKQKASGRTEGKDGNTESRGDLRPLAVRELRGELRLKQCNKVHRTVSERRAHDK